MPDAHFINILFDCDSKNITWAMTIQKYTQIAKPQNKVYSLYQISVCNLLYQITITKMLKKKYIANTYTCSRNCWTYYSLLSKHASRQAYENIINKLRELRNQTFDAGRQKFTFSHNRWLWQIIKKIIKRVNNTSIYSTTLSTIIFSIVQVVVNEEYLNSKLIKKITKILLHINHLFISYS